MRVALDTNVLAYAAGVNELERRDVALDLLGRLDERDTLLPVQVLGELFRVLVGKDWFFSRGRPKNDPSLSRYLLADRNIADGATGRDRPKPFSTGSASGTP
jgi:predicted nucleic acid-binding protein